MNYWNSLLLEGGTRVGARVGANDTAGIEV